MMCPLSVSVPPMSLAPTRSAVSPPAVLQVSLRDLFVLTSFVAAASALAVRWKPGVFVPAIGLFLTVASMCGRFTWLHAPERRQGVTRSAWLLFAGALILPAVTVQGCQAQPVTLYGWQVAWHASAACLEPVETARTWIAQPETRTWDQARTWAFECWSVCWMNFPNVIMALSLAAGRWRGTRWDDWLLPGLAAAAAISWCWAILGDLLPELRIGYFVWATAITLMFLSYRTTWRAVAAACAALATSASF